MTPWLAIAAINGFIAVAAGAFGAHGLSSRLDAHALQTFETAVRYQMYHALAIGLTALAARGSGATVACALFLAGIVLFSGSLYLFALTGTRAYGFVTPFGGVALLAGWATLVYMVLKAGPEQ